MLCSYVPALAFIFAVLAAFLIKKQLKTCRPSTHFLAGAPAVIFSQHTDNSYLPAASAARLPTSHKYARRELNPHRHLRRVVFYPIKLKARRQLARSMQIMTAAQFPLYIYRLYLFLFVALYIWSENKRRLHLRSLLVFLRVRSFVQFPADLHKLIFCTLFSFSTLPSRL